MSNAAPLPSASVPVNASPANFGPVNFGGRLPGIFRAVRVVSWLLLLLVPLIIACTIWRPAPYGLVTRFYRVTLWLLGVKIKVRGELSSAQPTLFVANHVSYLDILALGSVLPGRFVSKAEVKNWPYIGLVASLTRTLYIDRRARKAGQHADQITKALDAQHSLILFPEGTTGNGHSILPFKSTLFAAAAERPGLMIQPVAHAVTTLDDLPLVRSDRPLYTWTGTTGLAPHIWRLLCVGNMTLTVNLLPPFTAAGHSRQDLAKQTVDQVRQGFISLLRAAIVA